MNLASINTILVNVPKTYEDTLKTPSGMELYIDTRFDDVRHTIRYGTVISSPDPRFAAGDTVYFHHNIVRRIHTVEGRTDKYHNTILENAYEIQPGQIYATKRQGQLRAIAPYCFIKPMPRQNTTAGDLQIVSKQNEQPQWGIVKYTNEQLSAQGVENGDTIIFNLDSEYEYPVDGEKLYRMQTEWIIARICQ